MDKALAERLSAFGAAWGLPNRVPPGKGQTWVEPSVFEAYATHMVVNGLHDLELDRNDVLSLITGGHDDAKLDAIGLFIDHELILSEEDLDAALASVSEESKIEFIFVQATLMDYISQGKLEKTCTGVANFASPKPVLVENALVCQWRRLKDQLLSGLAASGISRKPSCSLYIVWPASATKLGRDHHGIFDLRRRDIARLDLFEQVNFRFVDGSDLLALGNRSDDRNIIRLHFSELVAYPSPRTDTPPSVESWGGCIPASRLLSALESADGRLKRELFAENVRFDLGELAGSVNEGIGQTLESPAKRSFHILNNGVTLVAREVRQIGHDTLECHDLKVINGCQTTHSLHRHRRALDDSVKVLAKVVATEDETLVDKIIVATNRQSNILPVEFMSRLPFVRRLQQHFDVLRDASGERVLWFERLKTDGSTWRRTNGQRVLGIEDMIRAYASTILERPELPQSADWKVLRGMVPETIFNADHALEVYEIAALILWRARELMHACGRGDAYPAKYHLMLAIRLLADPPSLPRSTRPAGEDYVRSMRETLLTDRRARQIAADAHTLVVAAAAGLGRAFNAQAFRKVDATQLVVDMAQRRTAAE